jgi:hypothetical protein
VLVSAGSGHSQPLSDDGFATHADKTAQRGPELAKSTGATGLDETQLAAMGDDAVMVMSDAVDPARPGWEWSAPDLRLWAHAAADLVADVLIDGGVGPAVRRPPHKLLEMWEAEPWPDAGAGIDDLWHQLKTSIAPYSFGNAHPRFSAWVNSPPHPLAAMAAGVAAAMNPSVAGGNHAAVHLEHQVVRWFCQVLDWSPPAGSRADRLGGGAPPRHRRHRVR